MDQHKQPHPSNPPQDEPRHEAELGGSSTGNAPETEGRATGAAGTGTQESKQKKDKNSGATGDDKSCCT